MWMRFKSKAGQKVLSIFLNKECLKSKNCLSHSKLYAHQKEWYPIWVLPRYHTSACGLEVISFHDNLRSKGHTISSPVAQFLENHKASNQSTNHGETEKQKNIGFIAVLVVVVVGSVTPGLDKTRSNTQGTVQRVQITTVERHAFHFVPWVSFRHTQKTIGYKVVQMCMRNRLNYTLGGWGYDKRELLELGENLTQIGTIRRLKKEKKKRNILRIVDLYDDGNNLDPRPSMRAGSMKQNPSKLFKKDLVSENLQRITLICLPTWQQKAGHTFSPMECL